MPKIPLYCPACNTYVGCLLTTQGPAASKQLAEVDPAVLARPLAEIRWRVQQCRITNALRNDNIETVAQLIEKSEAELMRIPNFGRVCIAEIKTRLAEFGLRLGMK
jgi:DNA-directed RNA polymerase subunit alpha